MARKKEYDYIAHVCANSRLEPIRDEEGKFISNHPNFCERGFVDICPTKSTTAEQCWKYCPTCEAKGFKSITVEQRIKDLKETRKDNLLEYRKANSGIDTNRKNAC